MSVWTRARPPFIICCILWMQIAIDKQSHFLERAYHILSHSHFTSAQSSALLLLLLLSTICFYTTYDVYIWAVYQSANIWIILFSAITSQRGNMLTKQHRVGHFSASIFDRQRSNAYSICWYTWCGINIDAVKKYNHSAVTFAGSMTHDDCFSSFTNISQRNSLVSGEGRRARSGEGRSSDSFNIVTNKMLTFELIEIQLLLSHHRRLSDDKVYIQVPARKKNQLPTFRRYVES